MESPGQFSTTDWQSALSEGSGSYGYDFFAGPARSTFAWVWFGVWHGSFVPYLWRAQPGYGTGRLYHTLGYGTAAVYGKPVIKQVWHEGTPRYGTKKLCHSMARGMARNLVPYYGTDRNEALGTIPFKKIRCHIYLGALGIAT